MAIEKKAAREYSAPALIPGMEKAPAAAKVKNAGGEDPPASGCKTTVPVVSEPLPFCKVAFNARSVERGFRRKR